jgi:hypothetical protein
MPGTGAHFAGIARCPGCGRQIAGMIPQRCFFCGHDFSTDIQEQNPDFVPDPLYKTPIDPVTEYTDNLERTIEALGDDLFPRGPEGCKCTWGRDLETGTVMHEVNPACPTCGGMDKPNPFINRESLEIAPEYDVDSDAEEVDESDG